ncbi:hypothetical protein EVJ58_g3412 [Rhodofomes roseus]|uniref:Transmembrane protein n=1 Tax=Rhodofomes roseus TaxID=34475 RepID=A0A4Y9YKR4_9APHY|nr:hypothetical protein EVJ58_g3412 [Rhodofomes roseus]
MGTGWNFTVDDSSSFITYKPFEDGGLGDRTLVGWEPSWSGSGGFPTAFAIDASGQSLHSTALDGASLSFQFYGNAVYLHGSTNGTLDVTIDNNVIYSNGSAMGDGLLYFAEELATQTHYITMTAHFTPDSEQLFQFDFADVTYTFSDGSQGPPLEVPYPNTNTSVFQYTGQWSEASAAGVPSPTSTAPHHITSQYGSSVSMNFTGGEAVAVYGVRDWGNWIYNVTMDGYKTQYNGSTPWKQESSLLFFQAGLDPNQTHTIVLTDDADQTYFRFMFNSVSVFQANHTSSEPSSTTTTAGSATNSVSAGSVGTTRSTHTGAIAGGVVGSIAGLLLIIGLFLWLFRRRGSSKSSDVSPFPILPTASSSSSGLRSLKVDFAPTSGTTYTGPVMSGVYHRDMSMGQPLTYAPATTFSTNAASSNGASTATGTAHTEVSPVAGVPSSPSEHAPAVSVDRIIELIAQRIDRGLPAGAIGDDIAPPRYPGSVVQ